MFARTKEAGARSPLREWLLPPVPTSRQCHLPRRHSRGMNGGLEGAMERVSHRWLKAPFLPVLVSDSLDLRPAVLAGHEGRGKTPPGWIWQGYIDTSSHRSLALGAMWELAVTGI